MSDWPTERIWTDGHDIYTESYAAKFDVYTEYIRADLFEQRIKELEAERDALKDENERMREEPYIQKQQALRIAELEAERDE